GPRGAAASAPSLRPPLHQQAIVPSAFRLRVSWSAQGHPFKSFPAVPGIPGQLSRRTPRFQTRSPHFPDGPFRPIRISSRSRPGRSARGEPDMGAVEYLVLGVVAVFLVPRLERAYRHWKTRKALSILLRENAAMLFDLARADGPVNPAERAYIAGYA